MRTSDSTNVKIKRDTAARVSGLPGLLLLGCLMQLGCSAQKQAAKLFAVSGKVMQTSQYCGGARPSEEMLQEYALPKPYAGKVLYVRKGKVNNTKQPVVATFTVGADGSFSLRLPAGSYSIIQAEQVKALKAKDHPSSKSIQVDQQCLKDWWKKPYYLLEIKEQEVSGLEFVFNHRCFVEGDVPCKSYTGPMPP